MSTQPAMTTGVPQRRGLQIPGEDSPPLHAEGEDMTAIFEIYDSQRDR